MLVCYITLLIKANGAYYILWFASRYLIFLNAAINPVIYGLTSEKFRKAFRQTTVSKFMFAFEGENNQKVKNNKQKQNTGTSNKNIFFIFRIKMQKNNLPINETVMTNSDSNAPIIDT
ncbi:hypothetical protein RN001_013106 [Aquatica leii]|uniref:Uncharacterized protein n=1 Tax=Aquatica leii TaxID=1421715 RepID=A0AAN7P1V7_9COLE|nr:hypothetical protein RN001_013106 [Aquatica leii]